jgi:hypothetical protein
MVMATVNEKMTALANGIRELSGTTDTKSLDEMKIDVDAANTEITEQAELIAQITTALEGKAGGGTVLPTLDNPAVAADILSGKEAIDGDGNVITGTITTRTSSNLTASGATVMVPSGYYASNASKSVATATQATPSVSIDANGKISASATQTAGYVSAGTKTGTKQMTTQAAKTITPSTSSQTAVAKNVYTTGAVTVAAIPSNYEDVGAETTEYTSLNAELEAVINSLPEASGGSGGSVETCTVTLNCGTSESDTAGDFNFLSYTAYQNNDTIPVNIEPGTGTGPQTISNIIKGSSLTCVPSYYGSFTVTGDAERVDGKYYGNIEIWSITGDASIHCWSCFVRGTKILLFNNKTKEVQDITYDDELLVWDFDNGCCASAKPLWIKKTETATYYYRCIFENETVLDLVGSNGNCHAVFCLDDNKFEYANKCVGKTIMTKNGPTKLLSCDKIEDSVEFYNIITDYHMNLFANNILTSTTMNNIYPIENMRFVKENRESIPYEAFSEIPIEFYKGLRLDENKLEDIDKLDNKVKMILSKMSIASKEVNTNV